MDSARLLIVEDERIVAEDLRDMLKRLGYEVVGVVSSGEEAILVSEKTRPDLVLMDIRLNGALDGIQAAETIWTHQEIPVTYLTAYADESTLERAKATMPFGYILKPFEERELRTTIEMALYRHRMESTLKKMDGWYASTLESLSDGVIATTSQGGITFMNAAAESITGWPLREVYGKKFNDTFRVSPAMEADSAPANPATRPMGMLKTREGREVRIEYGISPIKDPAGLVTGNVVILHRAVPQKEPQQSV